ncbi:MAG: hydroxymethylglutaryl-CoA synthase [Candidatus Aenigmarchaeota archaeon]|nr:hydroxymethylglutaryl-CoA synthase [Candidatus Aenigmarchaeota archaeon]
MSEIGISGYGCYVPRFRIRTEEIARVWGQDGQKVASGLGVTEKAVADSDEDTATISVEAARNALSSSRIAPEEIGAVFVGSESHPYAVKPTGTIVAEALMCNNDLFVADYEFACKAGTAAMQTCFAMVKAGMVKHGLAIGADTAQGKPGDALEYTAASGGAAFIIGNSPLAVIEDTYSFTTDTPDFWRREGDSYPHHGHRFTGEPAYFRHVETAAKNIMQRNSLSPHDFNHAVFHMPNAKFPQKALSGLGLEKEQFLPGLIVTDIGNTYSGSSPLGLCAVLDIAKPGDRILLVSYGSGAGSDAFVLRVTDEILNKRTSPPFSFYRNRKEYIDYATYAKIRGKLIVK